VINGRKGVGIELKPSYYRQAVKNVHAALSEREAEVMPLFETAEETPDDDYLGRINESPKAPHTWKKKRTRRAEETERHAT
jgi:hypothetical protein